MSSNAPRQQFAQVDLCPGLFRVPNLVRCTAGRREMAAHWHKSGMKKISSLSYCCTGSAKCCVKTTTISQNYPEAFHFRRKTIPSPNSRWPPDCFKFRGLAWRNAFLRSHVRFHWDGAGCTSIY
jgi:hypothetical protein